MYNEMLPGGSNFLMFVQVAPWPEDPPLEEDLYPDLNKDADLSHPLMHQSVSLRVYYCNIQQSGQSVRY